MSPIDDELRRTLGGRAADVAPMSDPIAGIEARAHRMHRQRQAAGAACAVALIATAAAVLPMLSQKSPPVPITVLTGGPRPTMPTTPSKVATSAAASPAVPTSSSSALASTPAAQVAGKATPVYYLGDTGTRIALYREWRNSPEPDRVRAAVAFMLKAPLDPDYQTLWPAGTTVRSVTVDGDVATVDLSAEALTGKAGSEAACQTLQQLVWTVTAVNPRIKSVRLSVAGRTDGVVSKWWGVGCGADAPMTRHAPSFEVLAPVQISKYQEGDRVKSRFAFGGEATVFEAVVSWAVTDAAGSKLAGGSVMVDKGAPERGLWQAIVVLPPSVKPGDVVQLRAWEASAKDGSVTGLDTKNVRIAR